MNNRNKITKNNSQRDIWKVFWKSVCIKRMVIISQGVSLVEIIESTSTWVVAHYPSLLPSPQLSIANLIWGMWMCPTSPFVSGFLFLLLVYVFFFGHFHDVRCCWFVFAMFSVNVRANSKDLTTEEMRKLIERSVINLLFYS